MKKIIFLIVSCFLVLFTCVAFAWDDPFATEYRNPAFDPEKIYFFDVDIAVRPDASIQITEKITLNAKGQRIRRGIYRDLPVSGGR